MLEILAEIEANEGGLTEEVIKQLEITNEQLEEKSLSYLGVIKDREALDIQIDDEIKRLQALKKSNGNLVKRLKDNLLQAVNVFGEYKAGLHKFGIRKSVAVNVDKDCVNELPKEYKVTKVTEQPDKKAIKKALQDGKELEGCSLVTNFSLSIK